MTTQISTQTILFNNQALITFEQNGKHYTAMKPICENIGLAWEAQLARIKRDEILSQGMIVMITPSNGGNQQMICLPIEYLNGWLFGIDVNRCKPEIRETLIKYKKECYQALHDYWFKGKAERNQVISPEQQQAIQSAVQQAHHRTGLHWQEIYRQIKAIFHVAKYDQLPADQFGNAMAFITNLQKVEQNLPLAEPNKRTPLVIIRKDSPELKLFLRLLSHAFEYSKIQEAIRNGTTDPNLLPVCQHLLYRHDNGDGFMFSFKANVQSDLDQASNLIAHIV